MAAEIQSQNSPAASSSSNDADDRRIWDIIWKAEVPEKIRLPFFGWRVATGTLATEKKIDSVCNLCGCDEEDGFHAMTACTKSRALRHDIKSSWLLTREDKFRNNGSGLASELIGSM